MENGHISPGEPVCHNMITPAVTSVIQGVPIWATIDLFVSCPLIVTEMLLTLFDSIKFLYIASHHMIV